MKLIVRFLAVFFLVGSCHWHFAAENQISPAALPLLTNVTSVLSLSRAEAARRYPVQIAGTVTLFERQLQLCFIQDQTEGIYVYNPNWDIPLEAGQTVLIRAISASGLFAPILVDPKVQVLGRGHLPTPRLTTISEVNSGREDSQFVAVNGIVQSQEINAGNMVLDLASKDGQHLKVRVLASPPAQNVSWIDAWIQVRGVAANSFSASNTTRSFHLLVSSFDNVSVLEQPHQDPFSLPPVSINQLSSYTTIRKIPHRVHLQGIMTMQRPGHFFFLQQGETGIRINTPETLAAQPGNWIDVVGFPLPGPVPALENAQCKTTSRQTIIPAIAISPGQALEARFEGRLVELLAVVTGFEMGPDLETLTLKAGETGFRAHLPKTSAAGLSRMTPGSSVLLTGICIRDPIKPSSFELWLRSAADVRVLARPFLWNSRWVGGLSLIFVTITGVLACRVWALEQKLKRKAAEETRLVTGWRESQKLLERSAKLRDRIARDLHDGIVQSIYAIGLSVDDCARQFRGLHSDLDSYLAKIRKELSIVVQDVRNFIVGLGPESLKGQEFKAALKSLVLTLGESASTRFALHIDPVAAEQLTPEQATQLLHVAREALTNTLKHASAPTAAVTLQAFGKKLRFEVKDDGAGFDQNAPDIIMSGLKNMMGRARDLNGEMEIASAPSQGTRIVLWIPASAN